MQTVKERDDQILCDQALYADVSGTGVWVITGCAHSGPLNTLIHVKELTHAEQLYGMVGGTHLVGRETGYIEQTILELRDFNLQYLSPCHCTGFKAAAMMWQAFPESFVLNYCGRVIKAGEAPRERVR